MRKILLAAFLFLGGHVVSAQIESMYSMYQINPIVSSPAFAGLVANRAKGEFVAINRQQWIGVQGSPRTSLMTGNYQLKPKIGIGAILVTDQAGPLRITSASGDLGYTVRLSDDWKMNGGIRLSVASVYIDYAGLTAIDINDPYIQVNKSTGLKPNTGWGLHFAHRGGTFLSVSQPRVLKYDFGNLSGAFKDVSYFYLQAGTAIQAAPGIRVSPSVMARLASSTPFSWDANVIVNLQEKVDVGLIYRDKISYGARVGVPLSKKVYVAYTGEFPLATLNTFGVQTHELALKISLFEKQK